MDSALFRAGRLPRGLAVLSLVVSDASYCCCEFKRAAIVYERVTTDKTEWI
jgi:hypothetical protein